MNSSSFSLVSPAFAAGQAIPATYTCQGQNISPPLAVQHVPQGTKSLALILHDPDAPSGDFLHWTMWNIRPDTQTIPAGTVPDGARQGKTDFGQAHYGGPCPPSGTHRYVFDLYALNAQLDLAAGADRQQLLDAMHGHTVAQATLTGTVSAR